METKAKGGWLKFSQFIMFLLYALAGVWFLLGASRSYIGKFSVIECIDAFLIWKIIETPNEVFKDLLVLNTVINVVYCIIALYIFFSLLRRLGQTFYVLRWKEWDCIFHEETQRNIESANTGLIFMAIFSFFTFICFGFEFSLTDLLFFALIGVGALFGFTVKEIESTVYYYKKVSFKSVIVPEVLRKICQVAIIVLIGIFFYYNLPKIEYLIKNGHDFFDVVKLLMLIIYFGTAATITNEDLGDIFFKIQLFASLALLIMSLISMFTTYSGELTTQSFLSEFIAIHMNFYIPFIMLTLSGYLTRYYP